MIEHEQVARFLARFEHVAPPERDADTPEVVFRSALELTFEQEDALVQHCMQRYRDLEQESGREYVTEWHAEDAEAWERDQVVAMTDSFLGRRMLMDQLFHQELDDRPALLQGIFRRSNHHLPLARRLVAQQIARAADYFFATDPWFSVEPVGRNDEELARKAQEFARFKARQSGLRETLDSAIEGAFIKGEEVVKTSYRVDVDYHETFARVTIGADGEPMIAGDGDYIYEEDQWVLPDPDPLTGEQGPMVLQRDGVTPQPAQLVVEERKIRRRMVVYRGSETRKVYYRDFLAPREAESLEKADCIVHLYDQPVMGLVTHYMEQSLGDGATEEMSRVLDLLQNMSTQTGEPKAAAAERPEQGEHPGSAQARPDPVAKIGEFWLRYDANEDGIAEHIFMLVDMENEAPIYYDYVANVTPDGQRPFSVIRVNPVDGRWHGSGEMWTFYKLQAFGDTLINRMNQSQSEAGRVVFWNPHLTEEGKKDPRLKMNGGTTYTLVRDARVEDVIKVVQLNDNKSDQLHNHLQIVSQAMLNMSGVANTNDAGMAGLDTTKLATGIRHLENSGQELFGRHISALIPGTEAACSRELKYLFYHLDAAETFRFHEEKAWVYAVITPDDVHHLEFNLSLELTRYKGEKDVAQAIQARQCVFEFYQLTPAVAWATADMFRQQLHAYGVRNADEIINPDLVPDPAMPMQGDPQAATAAAAPPLRRGSPTV